MPRSFLALFLVLAMALPASAGERMSKISKLAEEAIAQIDKTLDTYGEVSGFGNAYGSATRGIIDGILSEWTLHAEIASITETDPTNPKLAEIRALLAQAQSQNQQFMRSAKEQSSMLAGTPNAVRFRSHQIGLYDHLLAGLRKDRDVLAQVLEAAQE